VYDALAIYDTMQFVTNDVQTVGIGMQASAAAFLLRQWNQRQALRTP